MHNLSQSVHKPRKSTRKGNCHQELFILSLKKHDWHLKFFHLPSLQMKGIKGLRYRNPIYYVHITHYLIAKSYPLISLQTYPHMDIVNQNFIRQLIFSKYLFIDCICERTCRYRIRKEPYLKQELQRFSAYITDTRFS